MRNSALASLALLLMASSTAGAENDGGFWTTQPKRKAPPLSLADLAERARPAVVHVRGISDDGGSSGGDRTGGDGESGKISIVTGFIINKDGYVVTNEHVVRAVVDLRVRLYDGRELPA